MLTGVAGSAGVTETLAVNQVGPSRSTTVIDQRRESELLDVDAPVDKLMFLSAEATDSAARMASTEPSGDTEMDRLVVHVECGRAKWT